MKCASIIQKFGSHVVLATASLGFALCGFESGAQAPANPPAGQTQEAKPADAKPAAPADQPAASGDKAGEKKPATANVHVTKGKSASQNVPEDKHEKTGANASNMKAPAPSKDAPKNAPAAKGDAKGDAKGTAPAADAKKEGSKDAAPSAGQAHLTKGPRASQNVPEARHEKTGDNASSIKRVRAHGSRPGAGAAKPGAKPESSTKPKTDQPKTDQSKTDQPKADQPKTDQPAGAPAPAGGEADKK